MSIPGKSSNLWNYNTISAVQEELDRLSQDIVKAIGVLPVSKPGEKQEYIDDTLVDMLDLYIQTLQNIAAMRVMMETLVAAHPEAEKPLV